MGFRKHRGIATKIGIAGVVRALKLFDSVKRNFSRDPKRLSSMVNYALYLFTIETKPQEAIPLLNAAVELSALNPVVVLSRAIVLLSTATYARSKIWDDTIKSVANLHQLNPDAAASFGVAEQCFFMWSVNIRPNDPVAWSNLALVRLLVHDDYNGAARYFRRALG